MSELAQQISYRGAPHEPDAPALFVEGVYLTYAAAKRPFTQETAVYALENITFQAQEGDQIAIIGPNGAGKSSILKIVAGILTPDHGHVEMFGHVSNKHVCIAYVPQRNEIDWTFPVTVTDVVMMGRTKEIGLFRRPSKQDHQIVARCLARVEAEHLAEKQIGELSGGQQQRVFIARSLALETNLLLMDEPLAGLDIPSQERILDILDDVRQDGVTVLVATHDLNMAAERFDRIMLLNRQIVAFGSKTAVLSHENLLKAYSGA